MTLVFRILKGYIVMKKARKILIAIIAISLIASMFATSVSATETIAFGAATVDTSNLNVRTGPSLSHPVITTLDEGDIIVILE